MKKEIILQNVEIESVAAEGKAVSHVDGMTLFVPFAVPGDIVNVRVFKKKHSFMEGMITQIVKPSEHRLEPFCAHFGVCGGCKWQPLPYPMQLSAKRQQVIDQFVRIGHLQIPQVEETIPSDRTEFYRNKLEFTFSERRWILPGEDPDSLTADQRVGLGFHVGRFFDKVLDIRKCSLQGSKSNEIRNFIREYAIANSLEFFNIREHRGFLRNMVVRSNEKGEIMLTVVFYREYEKKRTALLDAVKEHFPEVVSLYYVINGKANDSLDDQKCILYGGQDAIYENLENLSFKIGPKSFFQTNTRQALKLYSVARDFAALTGKETVYDLYTGTGTIAQFVSGKALKVIGIEYVEDAIRDARLNAQANGISNCEFFAGDMKDILTDAFIREHGRPDVIILDPPRAGIHPDVAKVILNAAPDRIVYVSCNPASQARDLQFLCAGTPVGQEEESVRYVIDKVQPVDMFPHTQHVENVVALHKVYEQEDWI